MQAKSFFSSLFDYSFSSYITPKMIRVLYVLTTIVVVLWTLAIVFVAFKASTAAGILTLVIFGPIIFVITMIYVRVGLELLMAFFRIHGDVEEINHRGRAGDIQVAAAPEPAAAPIIESASTTEPAASTPFAPEPVPEPQRVARFCDNCGAEARPGKRFCTGCGQPLE